LVTPNTIDEKILKAQERKMKIAEEMINDENKEGAAIELQLALDDDDTKESKMLTKKEMLSKELRYDLQQYKDED
jgi:SNF2 family DNA or RNA helicase